jgi:hypothetical protein
VLDINAMPNFCIVPAGASVTIDWYRDLRTTGPASVRATLDTSGFTNSAAIHYNGVAFPNARIISINPALGGNSWTFGCITQNYADIEALQVYAGPLQLTTSITGKQLVICPYRAGTLKIKNTATGVYDAYSRCYIQGPISVEPFGDSYFFQVKVVQSAYDE